MSATPTPAPGAVVEPLAPRFRDRPFVGRFLASGKARWASLFLLVVVLVLALGPLVMDGGNAQSLTNTLKPPSSEHWLGTDELGRDLTTRMLHGGRTTMLAAVQAVAIAVGLALPLGLLAGYVGGWVDAVLSRMNDGLMSAPSLVIAVTVVAALGPGLTNAMLAVGIIMVPLLFRIVRGATLSVRSETYVEAARAIGCSHTRIMGRHILLNIVPPVLVQISLLLGVAMLAESGLSFLGLGARPPTASWGAMLRDAFDNLYLARHLMYPPGIAIGVVVFAFSQLGDGLRDALSTGRRGS